MRHARSDCRQRRNRSGGVGEAEVGVGVHGEADVAVAHELLGDAGRDAVAGHEGGEGVAEAVDVDGAALGVAFGDPGGGKVEVEGTQEVSAEGE